MANASDYLEQQIYNHIFRDAEFSKPSTVCLGLTLDVPTDSSYEEVANANGYARYEHASGDASWSAMGVNGEGTNDVAFEFDAATGDWGTVSGVIITDDAGYGAGNVLFRGALTQAREVRNGDTFRFTAGSLDITIA